MEYLDIVDEYGEPTGKVAERSVVHLEGLPHRTSHVWLVRNREQGVEILLQRRSLEKDCFPGDYDISSAGHIPAGQGYPDSALRELREELGVEAGEEDLVFCGDFHIKNESIFHGEPFRDDVYSRVFYMWKDLEPEAFTIQKSEISEVRWIGLDECIRLSDEGEMPCLFPQELQMLKKALG